MLLLIAMVTLRCFALLTALARSILVQMTEVTCVNQGIMLGSEVEHDEVVTLWAETSKIGSYFHDFHKEL